MERPHAVMLTISGQGHINPMLQLAKLLHFNGFFITFVTTDGLLVPGARSRQHVAKWCLATYDNCVAPFRDLLIRINSTPGLPCITCIVYNWLMSFALDVADELSIPALVFSTMSACGFMADLHLDELIRRGYTPLRDESYLRNGFLDTPINWIPGMPVIRLGDLSSIVRTIDQDDFFLNNNKKLTKASLSRAKGLILNTFEHLETDVLNALRTMFSKVYTLAPLSKLVDHIVNGHSNLRGLNLWGEDRGCMGWLNTQEPQSVIYVSFGSVATINHEQLVEFAWGLAETEHPFVWVIRPDLVQGDGATVLPEDFVEQTRERCYIAKWCNQVEVLSHSSIGGFLTHCGWNSTLESICAGMPIICWPGFGEQYTNTRYVTKEWGIGMEIDGDVKRDHVSSMVKELMEGEKGKELRENVIKWKKSATLATMQGGSSYENLGRLIEDLNINKNLSS